MPHAAGLNDSLHNKVVYNGQTIVDLGDATITGNANHESALILKGADTENTAYGPDGKLIYGTCLYNANTNDVDGVGAIAGDILVGKKAWVSGQKITGTMPNNDAPDVVMDSTDPVVVSPGYYSGGTVSIDQASLANLTPSNIRAGKTILGIAGELTPSSEVTHQSKTVATNLDFESPIVVSADEGYDFLDSVTIQPVPYSETSYRGGIMITIG